MSLCTYVLGEDDRQRRDALEGESSFVALRRVSLVEGLRGAFGWWGFVRPDFFVVTSGCLGGALHHDKAADLVQVVAQAIWELPAGRVEQQSWRLDRVPRHRHQPGTLAILAAFVEVDDPGRSAGIVDLDAAGHAVRPGLAAMSQRVGHV